MRSWTWELVGKTRKNLPAFGEIPGSFYPLRESVYLQPWGGERAGIRATEACSPPCLSPWVSPPHQCSRGARLPTEFHPHPPVLEVLTSPGRVGRRGPWILTPDPAAAGGSPAVLQNEPHSGLQRGRHRAPAASGAHWWLSIGRRKSPHVHLRTRAGHPLPEQTECHTPGAALELMWA